MKLIEIIENNLDDDGSEFRVNGKRVRYSIKRRCFSFEEDWSFIDLAEAIIVNRTETSILFRSDNKDYLFEIVAPQIIK